MCILSIVAFTGAGQIRQPAKQPISYAPPTLEVREFSGDFTTWSTSGSLNDGGLVKEFRWSTTRKDAASARYEVGVGLSSVNGTLALPPPGGFGYFSIGFQPLLNMVLSRPGDQIVFPVQVVLLDAQQQKLAPASSKVNLVYSKPAPGTRFDHRMAVFLKSIRCIETTSGPGADEIRVRVVGALLKPGGIAENLHTAVHEDLDKNKTVSPGAFIKEFVAFSPNYNIMVGLAEDDDTIPATLPRSGTAVENGPGALGNFKKVLCEGDQSEDDCIGNPQILPIASADWTKVVIDNQVVTRSLNFEGDGGRYRVVFELRRP